MAGQTNVISLPAWLSRKKQVVKKHYITSTGGDMTPDHIALVFALSLRIHGTADAIRDTARTIVDKVCREHKPNMKRLAREPKDELVFDVVLKIINRVTEKLDIDAQDPFLLNYQLPERIMPEFDESELFDLLEQIGAELADPREIAEEIAYLAEQVPEAYKGQLYLIAGAKKPRAVIQAAIRQYRSSCE